MKTHLMPALKLTAMTILLFVILYPALIWIIALVAGPNNGRGEISSLNGKVVGYTNVGQKFTADKYFWSRPSAVDYNAASSCGSNKGPSNPDYLQTVKDRIDTFLVHNPTIKRSQIPADMVTASGSGLDPHISPEGAIVQVPRIAKIRGISESKLVQLVNEQIENPLLGMFGTSRVNVLKLNLALENMK